ncbi:MAG: ribosome silencing factor [Deltaproteobacteria bacterium]|nr:ribosome silencing factor [Deltaproteobacteria bacterium]
MAIRDWRGQIGRGRRCAIDSLDLARNVAGAVMEKKGDDVVILNIGTKTSFADYFVIASAGSERQVKAIAGHIEESLKKEHGLRPLGLEGSAGSSWVLVDYGSVVAHIFHASARHYYDLDGLWFDAPRVAMGEAQQPAR